MFFYRIALAGAMVRQLQRTMNACQTAAIPSGMIAYANCTNFTFTDLRLEALSELTVRSCTTAFAANKTLQCLPLLVRSDVFEHMKNISRPEQCTDIEWSQMQATSGAIPKFPPGISATAAKSAVEDLFNRCEELVPGVTTSALSAEQVLLIGGEDRLSDSISDSSSTITAAMFVLFIAAFSIF
jgi:hypothetical protein